MSPVAFKLPGDPDTTVAAALYAPEGDRNLDALLQLAQDEAVHLTVVGPEGPLVLGVVDRFRAAGLRIFGPTRAAAQLVRVKYAPAKGANVAACG